MRILGGDEARLVSTSALEPVCLKLQAPPAAISHRHSPDGRGDRVAVDACAAKAFSGDPRRLENAGPFRIGAARRENVGLTIRVTDLAQPVADARRLSCSGPRSATPPASDAVKAIVAQRASRREMRPSPP